MSNFEQKIIDAIFEEAVEDLHQFVKGMKVLLSYNMKLVADNAFTVYAYEIRSGKHYITNEVMPHLR